MRTIARLPEDFRLALVAVDVLGLSYREAARALKVREATITTRLFRARGQVARALDPELAADAQPSVPDAGRATSPHSEQAGRSEQGVGHRTGREETRAGGVLPVEDHHERATPAHTAPTKQSTSTWQSCCARWTCARRRHCTRGWRGDGRQDADPPDERSCRGRALGAFRRGLVAP